VALEASLDGAARQTAAIAFKNAVKGSWQSKGETPLNRYALMLVIEITRGTLVFTSLKEGCQPRVPVVGAF